jgi:hypothetical protein
MATILLSAAGLAIGGSIGGSVLGLSTAVVGRAAGAMLGRAIDERLLGQGSAPVETGKVDRFRLTGSGEGAALARLWGRARVGGQVIWSAARAARAARAPPNIPTPSALPSPLAPARSPMSAASGPMAWKSRAMT